MLHLSSPSPIFYLSYRFSYTLTNCFVFVIEKKSKGFDCLFIFNVHDNKFSMNWPLYLFSLISGKESPVPGPFDLGTRPFFQDGLVSAMLKRNGFQIEKVVHLGIVPNFLYGLPVFTSLYYKLDLLMYKHQLLKTIAVERIYYCKKIT